MNGSSRPLPFFYGWVIVGVAVASCLLGAGLNNISMAVVFKPLTEDLGWSRTVTAGAVAAGSLTGGLLAPFFGRLADRLGPRVLLPSGAAAVGLLALAMSGVNEVWQFYAVYVPARALAEPLLLGVVPLTAIAAWFYRMRPRAMGLVIMAVPLGSSAIAILYQILIASFGWRSPFVALGIVLCVLLVVPSALLLRRRPEDLGLLPDGGVRGWGSGVRQPARRDASPTPNPQAPSPEDNPQPPTPNPHEWAFRDAVRTPAFWLLVGSGVLASMATAGVAFNLVAYYTDLGIDPSLAAGAISVFALSGAVGSGLWAFLAESISPRHLGIGLLLVGGAALLLLLLVDAAFLAYAFAGIYGLTARGQGTLTPILMANYFGRRAFGSIMGFADPFLRIGLGLGPFVGAAAFDLTGTYQGIFLLFTAAFTLSAVLIFLARAPARWEHS